MLLQNVSLKNYNTFKIGGNAKFFSEPKSVDEIADLFDFCETNGEDFFVLGRGSNVLFSDEGFDGVVIKIGKNFLAGKSLHDIIQNAAKKGLGGIEKLEGIPGTLGGAIFMNAGAHKQQISDCIKSVISISINGNIITRYKDKCEFAYRDSIFKRELEIIISAEFDFIPMDKETINKNRKEVLAWRKEKQPLNYPNAGSVFKNPASQQTATAQSAGYLIESCGLKGFSIGDAQVSELHANFIINRGRATAQNIKDLIEIIKEKVSAKHGVLLETEIMMQ